MLFARKQRRACDLKPHSSKIRNKSPVLAPRCKRDAKLTLSQTWTTDKLASAICVQNVNAQGPCFLGFGPQLNSFHFSTKSNIDKVVCDQLLWDFEKSSCNHQMIALVQSQRNQTSGRVQTTHLEFFGCCFTWIHLPQLPSRAVRIGLRVILAQKKVS